MFRQVLLNRLCGYQQSYINYVGPAILSKVMMLRYANIVMFKKLMVYKLCYTIGVNNYLSMLRQSCLAGYDMIVSKLCGYL